MSTENEGAASEVDATDTAAVLAAAEGAPAPVNEAPAAEDAPGESETAPEAPAEGEQPKPKQTAQERIDELTRVRRDAERERDFWKAKAEEAAAGKGDAPKPEDGDARPNPDDYEFGVTDDRYIEALADYKAGKKVDERFAERDAQTEFRQVLDTFRSRTAQAFPEGEPEGLKAYRQIAEVPSVLQDIVLRTGEGPKLAEHYGNNPADLQRLSALPPHLQAFEIGQLQARLATPATPAPAPTKNASDAPDPPSHQTRGAGGQFKPQADTDDFASFEAAYVKK